MKRGLIALIAIAFVFTSFNASSMAPVINNIPDVVITCKPDVNDGLTVGLNFFRYVNAFNILDYVTDEDSTSDLLSFAFIGADANDDIAINHNTQVAAALAFNPPEDSDPTRGTDGSYWWTFQDLIRSPNLGGWVDPEYGDYADNADGILPYHDETGALTADSRVVSLYVSDGYGTATKSFAVWSVEDDVTVDSLSGGKTTVFTTTLVDWEFSGFAGTDEATHSQVANLLTLQASTSVGTSVWFGRWATPLDGTYNGSIPYEGDFGEEWMYVALYTIKHNLPLASVDTMPNIRIGSSMAWDNVLVEQKIGSASVPGFDADAVNPYWPDADTEQEYGVYWESFDDAPNFDNLLVPGTGDVRTWHAFFDILSGPGSGPATVSLTGYEVYAVDVPGEGTVVSDYQTPTVGTAAGDWVTDSNWLPTLATVSNHADGILFDAGAVSGSYSFAVLNAPDTVPWQADKVVRLTATLKAVNTRDFHLARVRGSSASGALNNLLVVKKSTSIDAITPGTAGMSYSSYMASYGGPSADLVTATWDNYGWGVDYIANVKDGSVADTADFILDSAKSELLDEADFL